MRINHEATASTEPVLSGEGVDGSKQLMPHHRNELMVGSGLSETIITAAGIYSEWTPAKLGRLLKLSEATAKRMVPAIVFPYTRADGSNGYARVKADRPRIIREKPAKYETPKGESNEIYLPPGVAQYLGDVNQELLVTEGEKKSLAATDAGFPCIGLVGVYGWKEAKKEILLPELRKVAWQGRRVYIAFDSDGTEKEGVQDGESRLAAAIAAQGGIPLCLRIPSGPDGAKQGLDDFLVAAGADGKRLLRKLIDEAVAAAAPDPDSVKTPAGLLDPAEEAEKFLDAGKVDGFSRLRQHRGGFVFYIGGRYADLPASEVRARLVNHVNQFSHHMTTGVTANIFQQVQAKALLPISFEPPCWLVRPAGCELWEPADLITTKNAIIHLPTLATAMEKPDAGLVFSIPATPRYFSPCALPFDFDIKAAEPKHWLEFLSQVWGDDAEAIETLQEWMGLCLVPDTSLQKILLLLGPKRSGKGTIARVLRAIVGDDNCCGPTMGSLGMNFGLQALLNKSVAIISDARLSGRTDSAVVTERLLSISGEDALTVDIKHREPVTAKLLTRIVIMTNELPRLGDSSGALAGRLIILRMTETFYGREDHRLTAKLMEERAGILRWAVVGLKRLRDRGYLIQPESGNDLREQMEDIASPIGQFVRERCELGSVFDEPTKSLYLAYAGWTTAKGGKPTTDSIFARDLNAAFPAVRSVRRRGEDSRYYAYQGIRLLPDWSEGS